MGLMEIMIEVPMEHEQNVCGQLDKNVKMIERTLNVTIVAKWANEIDWCCRECCKSKECIFKSY